MPKMFTDDRPSPSCTAFGERSTPPSLMNPDKQFPTPRLLRRSTRALTTPHPLEKAGRRGAILKTCARSPPRCSAEHLNEADGGGCSSPVLVSRRAAPSSAG